MLVSDTKGDIMNPEIIAFRGGVNLICSFSYWFYILPMILWIAVLLVLPRIPPRYTINLERIPPGLNHDQFIRLFRTLLPFVLMVGTFGVVIKFLESGV